MAREPSKTRKWEKERRDRLNEAFNTLSKRLPCYNPSVTIVKIDILTKAAEYIKELEEKVNALVSSNPEKNQTENDYLKKLQDRIKKLLIRNEQLCNLLKDAKISIPSVSGTVKKFKTPHLWSNRINAEQAKLLQKEEVEKKINCVRKTSKRKSKISSTSIAPKHRKSLVLKTNDNKVKPLRKKTKDPKNLNSTTSNCVIVISQASVTHPCYIISSTPANSNAQTKTTTVTTNPTVVSAPVVSRTVKPSVLTGTNSSLSTLGPGTLILANGAILPVLPPTPSIVPVAPTLISNNVNTSLIMVSNISTSQINSNTVSQIATVKTVERKRDITVCKPVRPKICLTRTTQVNKVPIPALTSRYANNYIILSNTQKPNTTKNKIKVVKKIRSVRVEKKTSGESKTDTEECLKRKLEDSEEAISKKAKPDLGESDGSKLNSEIRNDRVDIEEHADVTDGEKVNLNGSDSEPNLGIAEVTSKETQKSSETNTAIGMQEAIQGSDMGELKNEGTTKNSEIPERGLPQKESVAEDTEVKSVHEQADQSSIIPDINEATENEMKTLEINLPHSELSNDFLASLQVPAGCQNPESTSPTAAFLLTFPLVSSLNGVKVTEVIDEDNTESQRETPNLLQIGTMVNTKTTSSQSEALTPSLLNLDSFSFFTGKEFNNSFCNNFTTNSTSITTSTSTVVVTSTATFSSSNTMMVNKKASDTSANMDTQDRRKMDLIGQKDAFNADKSKPVVNVLETKMIPTSVAVNIHDITHTSTTYIKPPIQNMPKPAEKIVYEPTHGKGYTNSHVPGSFPNPPEQLSHESNINNIKTSAICTYASVSKSYCNSVNAQNNYTGYNYNTNNNYNQNYFNKNVNKVDNRSSYYSLPNYENYSEYKKGDIFNSNFYNSANATKDNKYNTVKSKPSQTQSKAPINWMTAPDNRLQTSDYLLPSLSKESEFSHNTMYPPNSFVCNTQTTYFNTNSMYSTSDICNTVDNRKTLDLTIHNPISNNFQRTDLEEWSPTKMPQFLDPLVGDLGLTNNIFSEPKHDSKYNKERLKECKRSKPTNYENQTNFLSVSQLVDNNSKNETIPARTSVRRNSGNRSKNLQQPTNNKPKRKSQDNKDFSNYNMKPDLNSKHNQVKNNVSYGTPNQNDIFCENKVKNSSSNYSAEALIGHSNHTVQADLTKRQNYTNAPKPPLPVPPFLTDNIIPYFPPVEFPQDNNYMQQNQNYNSNNFTHNFSTFQNNAYTANSFMPSVSTITSTYIPTNNFVHETHDFMVDNFNLFPNTNKDKPTGKNQVKHPNTNVKEEKNVNYCKKQKKKTTNESNFPGFDIQYLSLPGSRNSPLLPDDFHTHTNFLPPATSYKITNPLYHKPNSEIAPSSLLPIPPPVPGNRSGNQPEISPSINTSGSSLTNFNLSTIFPEITKGPLPDLYRDTRSKEVTSSRNYNVTSSSLQVPFQNKSTFNFSYSQ